MINTTEWGGKIESLISFTITLFEGGTLIQGGSKRGAALIIERASVKILGA